MKRLGATAFAGLLLAGLAAPAAAQIPQEISYQAYLTDTTGLPVLSNNVNVTLDFWDADTGGTLLYSYSQTALDLSTTQGFVNLIVPTGVPADLSAAEINNPLWVEVTFEDVAAAAAPETLAPRQKLVPAPTAINADLLDGRDSTEFVDTSTAQTINGAKTFGETVNVTGTVTVSTLTPVNPGDVVTLDYVTNNIGTGPFMDLATDQTAAGSKTFTDDMQLELTNVFTAPSGETGAGFSLRATSDPAAPRSIGARSRILDNNVSATGAPKQVQGILGSAQSAGGDTAQINGGYFQARILDTATDGILSASAASGDVEVQPGAVLQPTNLLVGGRFGVGTANSGPAQSIGLVGTAANTTGPVAGPASGVLGIGAQSATANSGVVGAANATEVQIAGLIPSIGPVGAGVVGFNPNAGGTGVLAVAPTGTAIATQGDVSIDGKATQTTLVPTDPGDLVTLDFFNNNAATGGPFMDLANAQTAAGSKTFTDDMQLELTDINTITSGETGAGLSLRGTADPAAGRATGIRGRVLDTNVSASGTPKLIQGVMGSAQSDGGDTAQIDGGYFQARVRSTATDGAAAVYGVSADADVQAGATMQAGQLLAGGRAGSDTTNAGPAEAVGFLGTAVGTSGTHTGSASGLLGIGAGSTTANSGVYGAANADQLQIAGSIPTIGAAGAGVVGFNPLPGGTGVLAIASDPAGVGVRSEGDVSITGKATQSELVPTDPGDLVTLDYFNNNIPGGGPFMDLATAQTAAGSKTFTDIMVLDLNNISTSASGEVGAGFSLLSTADPAAARAIGARSRILDNNVSATGVAKQVQGILGSAQSAGGDAASINGGYFQARILPGTTDGVASATAASGDVFIDTGAVLQPTNVLIGGRFGVGTDEAGPAQSFGVVGTAAGTTGSTGPASGVLGVAALSSTSNAGVYGAANASEAQIAGTIPTVGAVGSGVVGFSPNPGGTGVLGIATDATGIAVRSEGNVSITGKATQTDLAPTAAGDLVPLDYLNAEFAEYSRTIFVKPSGAVSASPTGAFNDPFNDIVAAYAYAQTLPGAGNFFDRIAIVLMPGQHTLTSTLTMNTQGIDVVGLSKQVTDVTGTPDPMIVMDFSAIGAPASGARLQDLSLSAPNGSSNVVLSMNQGAGIIADVAIRRAGGGGTVLEVDVKTDSTLSIKDFGVFGDVAVTSYGVQTTFAQGFVTGTVTVTDDNDAATDFLAFLYVDALGGLSFTPLADATPGLGFGTLALVNTLGIGSFSYDPATVLQASGSTLGPAGTIPAPALTVAPVAGSVIANCIANLGTLTPAATSAGNVAGEYTAYARF